MFSVPLSNRVRIIRLLLVGALVLIVIAQTPALQASQPLLDINTASPAALAEQLPGIGPAKAKAIVAYRELHGPFTTLDSLTEVKGIGPGTLKKIHPLISVEPLVDQKNSGKDEALPDAKLKIDAENSQLQHDKAARNAVRAAINIAKRYATY